MIKKWILTIIIGTVAGIGIVRVPYWLGFAPMHIRVNGMSMFPTMCNNDYLIVDTKFKSLDRDDIVLFNWGDRIIVKRVIGLPEEMIFLDCYDTNCKTLDGRIFTIPEPYLYKQYENLDPQAIKVPKGHIFVMGDNRDYSIDSRFFGCIPLENVIGYVLWIL